MAVTVQNPTSPTATPARNRDSVSHTESGDSRIAGRGNTDWANYYSNPAVQAQLLTSDQKMASDMGIPLSQLSLDDVVAYAGQEQARDQALPWYAKVVGAVAIGAVTAGAGGAALAAGADAAGTAGVIGAGAAVGAGAGAANAALNGTSLGKGALLGAVGGGLGTVAGGVTDSLNSAGLPNAISQGVVKGAIGATTGAINGGAAGALQGGFSGAASGAIGAATGNSFAGTAAGRLAGIGAGTIFPAQAASSGGTPNMMAGFTNLNGSLSGLSNQQLISGGAGLLGAGLGVATAGNIGSMQNNAYTTAGNAANTMPWNTSSSGGQGGTFSNGSAGINYGNLTGAQNNFAQFAQQQSGIAGSLNGQNPWAVTNAGNTSQGLINNAIGQNQYATNAGGNLMNQGSAALQNPLINSSYSNANSLLGSAGANYNSAYNTSLQSQLAALNPQIQQQSNALLNSNFARGQAGSSGGALQTQALQNSFNQANLQAQSNAVSQANSLMGTTYNAASAASGIGNSVTSSGLNMFNSGNSAYNAGTNNGVALGQAGVGLQQNLASYAPTLAGQYQTNANNAVTGSSGINSQGLNNANFGLALGTNQGNQMNKAAQTQGSIANTYNGGTTGALSTMANSFGSLLGGSGGYGSLLSSIFGGGSNYAGGGSGNVSSSDIWNETNAGGVNNQYTFNPDQYSAPTSGYLDFGGGG